MIWAGGTLALLLMAAPLRAEIELQKLAWQARAAGGPAQRFADVDILQAGPQLWKTRLRGRVLLLNQGEASEEGILLRYAVTARLAPAAGGEGAWAVPCFVQERRVPLVAPRQTKEVPLITSPQLEFYLKRLALAGLKPESLKLQVMIEPHRGNGAPIKTLEKVLRVSR